MTATPPESLRSCPTAGTIAGLLEEAAATRPDRPLLHDVSGATLTVSEVAALSSAATRWLWDVGVRPGMTVAWQLPSNVNAAVVMMLALARAPVVQAPVLHLYRIREVCAAVDVARADILLVDESTVANTPAGMRTVIVPPDLVDQLQTSVRSPHPELRSQRPPTEAGWVERGLMKQKWPERLVLVDEFPLTGLGKIAKAELAQHISGGIR